MKKYTIFIVLTVLAALLAACSKPNVEITQAEDNIEDAFEEAVRDIAEETPKKENISIEADEPIVEPKEEPKVEVKAEPRTHYVRIVDRLFDPGQLTINKDDTVLWTHEDEKNKQHLVIAVGYKFKSQVLVKGQTFKHVFNEAGVYRYLDPLYSVKGGVTYEQVVNDTINPQLNRTTNETYSVKTETTEEVTMEGVITVN